MRALALALLLTILPFAAAAQLASLVADDLTVRGDTTLVATGRVEVLYDGVRLKARRITYDRTNDRLVIDGPIVLEDGNDNLVLADQAELDGDLANGILGSARLVLDRQLQLAATQIARVGNRYTQLDNTVASSCEVCAANPTPTWEIRARKVIHDQLERQLYFEGATFRLAGIPVAYFPRLRLPDPTLERTSGLLIPRLRTTSRLGTGIKQPLFLTLGDHADLRLTPYLSSSTRTLEAVYRQAFSNGELRFEGALTRDDLMPDETRWYLFGDGAFELARGFQLEFDVETVSDQAYLIDYDYSGNDRLTNELRIFRARDKDLLSARLGDFETLRDNEIPIEEQLPSIHGRIDYERRIQLRGGELRLGVDAATLTRESREDRLGRDVTSLGLSADYTRGFRLPAGLVGRSTAGLDMATYATREDSRFANETARISPSLSTELRLPLQRSDAGGVRHLIEPVAQLAWSTTSGNDVPNEDSVLVEFDEGNLFALSRYPGSDAIETGLRANLGVAYTRISPSGWTLGITVGRVVRADADENDFTDGSGLDGLGSDWLAATRLQLDDRIELTGRAIFDDQFDMTKNETRIGYRGDRLALETSYVWLNGDLEENRPRDTHELTLDAAMRLSRHWTGTFDARYDFNQDRPARTGVGLEYRSECIVVDLSVSRRFTETDNTDPSTSFGLGLSLAGIGSGRNDSTYRKTCKG